MKEFMQAILMKRALKREEAAEALSMLIEGSLSPASAAPVKAFLKTRQPSRDEFLGFVDAAQPHAVPLPVKRPDVVDVSGLGGVRGTLSDVLPAGALIAAGGGAAVALEMRRLPPDAVGWAQVFDACGVPVDPSPEGVSRCIQEAGIGLVPAPAFHPKLAALDSDPPADGTPSVLDTVMALCGVVNAKRRFMGAGTEKALVPFAEVLRESGCERAMVACARDRFDAISLGSTTDTAELKNRTIAKGVLTPYVFGVKPGSIPPCPGLEERAAALQEILKDAPNPYRSSALASAAVILVLAGKAPDVNKGYAMAEQSLKSGKALGVLKKLAETARRA